MSAPNKIYQLLYLYSIYSKFEKSKIQKIWFEFVGILALLSSLLKISHLNSFKILTTLECAFQTSDACFYKTANPISIEYLILCVETIEVLSVQTFCCQPLSKHNFYVVVWAEYLPIWPEIKANLTQFCSQS